MNKYQEAWKKIKHLSWHRFGNMIEMKAEFKEECLIIQELVDKATPMKPLLKVLQATSDKGHSIRIGVCGRCECHLTIGSSYCEDCGQAIVWSKNG